MLLHGDHLSPAVEDPLEHGADVLVAEPRRGQRPASQAWWFKEETGPLGPLDDCATWASLPSHGNGCDVSHSVDSLPLATEPAGPGPWDAVNGYAGPQSTGTGSTGTGSTGTGSTGTGPTGCWGGTAGAAAGDGSSSISYADDYRYVSVAEGHAREIDVSGLDTLPGSTHYAPTGNVELWYTGPYTLPGSDILEFVVVANGDVSDQAPRQLLLDRNDKLLVDGQAYDFLRAWPRVPENSDGLWPHQSYRALYTFENRRYVQIDIDVQGGPNGGCGGDLPLVVMAQARWFDLEQYQFRIDWGDGQTGLGTPRLTGDGQFMISGTHTYEWNEPQFPYRPTVSIYVQSVYGWQLRATRSGELEVSVPDASHWINTEDQQATIDGEVFLDAELVDRDPLTALYSYDVSVDWGDGTTSAGSLIPSPTEAGLYHVRGFHQYTAVGWYQGIISATASDGTTFADSFNTYVENLRPDADPQVYTLIHDRPFSANLLFTLGAGSGRSVTLDTDALHGTVVVDPQGVFTYQPEPRFLGYDEFKYRLWQNGVSSYPITVTLNVINHPPTATDDHWYVSHDRRFEGRVFGNDHDIDGDPFTATALSAPAHGLLVFDPDGYFEYLPEPGFQGIDQFSYRLSDGLTDSGSATVTLEVGNRLPALSLEQAYTVVHDRELIQSWPQIDPDGDVIQPTIREQPRHGTLRFDAHGTWSYQPQTAFVGSDSFSFTLYDGLSESDAAVVAIDVINNAPLAAEDTFRVPHDKQLQRTAPGIFANDSDPDGDSVSATLVENVKHGRLELQADGGFIYDPDPLYVGQDSFRYVLSDDIASTPPVLVTIDVEDHPPQATPLLFTAWPHDQTLIDNLNRVVVDADQDELTFMLESPPAVGELVLQRHGDFAYSPPPGYTGSVSFTYRVSDPLFRSDVGTVDIHVVQSLPTAQDNVHVTTTHDRVLYGNVSGNLEDVDRGEYLALRLISEPTYGTIAFNSDGSYSYRPHAGFVSQTESQWDRFSYQASDGRGNTAVVVQTIDVQNRSPVAAEDEYLLPHNKILAAVLGAANRPREQAAATLVQRAPMSNDYDRDGDRLTFVLVDPVSGQDTHIADLGLTDKLTWPGDGTFTFNPGPRGADEIEFYYVATDGLVRSQPARVLIHVQDTAPIARDDTYDVIHNLPLVAASDGRQLPFPVQQAVSLVTNDINLEGDTLTAVLVDPDTGLEINSQDVAPGVMQWNGDGTFIFQPELGFSGNIRLGYRLSDGVHQSNLALLTIRVARPGPAAVTDIFSTWHGVSLSESVASNDTAHGGQLEFQLVDAEDNISTPADLGLLGTLVWSGDGSFNYSPPPDWIGRETFRYRIFDGLDLSSPGTVHIDVNNEVPEAADSWRRVVPGGSYAATLSSSRFRPPLLQAVTDPQQDALQVQLVSDVRHGTLQLSPNGEFHYRPAANFQGQDGFAYRISDGLNESNVGQVVFNVTNRATEAVDDDYQTYVGLKLTKNVTYNDIDLDGDPIHASLLDAETLLPVEPAFFSSFGELQWNNYGGFTYSPAASFVGSFKFAYSATDGWEASDVAFVTINVGSQSELNRPPVARNDRLNVKPGSSLHLPAWSQWDGDPLRMPIGFNDRDPEGDPLTFQLVSSPAGHLTLHPDGSLEYAAADANGTSDSFQYRLSDGVSFSPVATVHIQVINNPPVATNVRFESPHDQMLSGNLTSLPAAYDSDRDPLIFSAVAAPQSGTLTLAADGAFEYLPDAGFVGADRFTFKVSDGEAVSQTATVILNVVNDPPQAVGQSFQLGRASSLVSRVLPYTSRDNDEAVAVLAGGPFYGSVSLAADGSFTYTPPADFVGRDTFTYYWRDVTSGSAIDQALAGNFATVTIEVISRAPLANNDVIQLSFGETQYQLDVLDNDIDPDGHGMSIIDFTAPSQGSLALLANGRLLYTPADPHHSGSDRFYYQTQGRDYTSLPTEVRLEITPLRLTANSLPVQTQERHEAALHLADLQTAIASVSGDDFVVDIDWGDGQRSAGTIVSRGDVFQVIGDHTFAQRGTYWAKVTVAHTTGFQVSVRSPITVLDTPLQVSGTQSIQATKQLPFQAVLARLVDDADANPDSYLATIDWGDGQQSPGLIRQTGPGKLEVYQGHMYSRRGSFPITVHITDSQGNTQSVYSDAVVSHVVSVHGLTTPLQGREVDGLVGRFTSSSIATQANQFIATVDWGDGTTSPGMIVGENGRFSVYGNHRYAEMGAYNITLLITEDDPAQTIVQAVDAVPEPGSTIRVWGRNIEIAEDQTIETQIVLAEFVDSDRTAELADYSVTIHWGDGRSSAGTVSGAAGNYKIAGEHQYAQPGGYQIKFTVDKLNAPASAEGLSSLLVTGVAAVGMGRTLNDVGEHELIATLVDNPAGGGYQARIRLAPGHYFPAQVQLTSPVSIVPLADGQPPSSSAASPYERQQLTINTAPQGGTFTLRFDGEVTAELPHNPSAVAIQNALNALNTIDEVAVSGGDGKFVIEFRGAHAYQNLSLITANGGGLTSDQRHWSIFTDTRGLPPGALEIQVYQPGSGRLTITSQFNPAEVSHPNTAPAHPPADLPTHLPDQSGANSGAVHLIEATGVTISSQSGTSFSGAVANLLGNTEGWQTEINWGDGATSAGSIAAGQVLGSHIYERPGTYRIAVALRKHDPEGTSSYDPWYYHLQGNPGDYWGWDGLGTNGWYYYPWWNSQTWLGNSWRQGEDWVGGVFSGASVAAATLSVTPQTRYTANANGALSNIDLLSSNAADNSLAVIQWGDGQTSEGTVTGGKVIGSHTYREPGFYTARITLRDGDQVAVATVEFDVSPQPRWPTFITPLDPGNIRGLEEQELRDVVVAKFDLDTPRRIGGLHQAHIDWGDGHQTQGKIMPLGSDKQIVVIGTHAYREAGAYDIAVTLLEQALTAEIHLTAVIDAGELSVTAHEFPAAINLQLSDVIVGELSLTQPDLPLANNYTARVDWGDGSVSAAKLVPMGDKILIVGSHTYWQAGQFQTTVWVEDGPVATRAAHDSAAIHVAQAFAGGGIDVFSGLLGKRNIPFDTLHSVQDLVQWEHQHAADTNWYSTFQTWERYRGFADLREQITWGDGATSDLSRLLPYYTFKTVGSLGDLDAWGWGQGYWWGWNAPQLESQGWWGQSGSLVNNSQFWHGLGWHGWGSGYGVPIGWGWNGYYGWQGWDEWSGLYGWGLAPWSSGSMEDNWPFDDAGTASDSGVWFDYGDTYRGSWAYDISATTARYESDWNWSVWNGSGFDAWQTTYHAFDRQRNAGTTQHFFEEAGEFDTSTTFGLNRTFHVAGAAIQSPDVRPVLVGFEGEALPETLLATFITSTWDTGYQGLWAEVDWGDGTETTMANLAVLPDQRLAVRGQHTYADEGEYPITIVLRNSAGLSRVLTSKATITDRTLAATAHDIYAVEEEDTGQVVVATIDAFRGDATSLTASIDWGDRDVPPRITTLNEPHYLSRGEIKWNATKAKYEVWGQHTYAGGIAAAKYYDLRIMINDHSQYPLVVESNTFIFDDWNANAQSRHQGFGESHTQTVAGALVSTNTGELLIAHALDFDLSPGTAVGGNPQLVFNSATANPRPIIQAVLASQSGSLMPQRFEARLIWDNQDPTPWTSFAVEASVPGTDYLIALQTPTAVRQTGVYEWTIEVRIYTSLPIPLTIAQAGQSVVVVQQWFDSDAADPFEVTAPWGMGWHLSTVDRLLVQANGDVIYVNGLGFPELFRNPQLSLAQPYELTGPPNEFGHLQFDPSQRSFTYTAKDQVRKYFNALGLMVLIERPGLPSEHYSYDAEGRLVEIQTMDGARTTLAYTDMQATSIHQPGGRPVGLLNTNGQLLRIAEATGNRGFNYAGSNLVGTQWGLLHSSFVYGAHERVFQVSEGPDSLHQFYPATVQGLQAFAQTADRDVALYLDPLGRQHWYHMDAAGRIERYTGPGTLSGTPAATEIWDRDDRFQIVSHSGPLGTSTFQFDDRGNLVTHNSLGQGTTMFSYDPKFNRPLTTIDPNGNATHYQIDSQTGLVAQTTNAAGETVRHIYASGLLISTQGLNGATTAFQYDAQRRLVAELGPQNRNRYRTYDHAGNLRTVQNANGGLTAYQYDARNRLISQTDGLGNSTLFSYDPSGLLIAKVDPNGRRTQYTYDQRGNQLAITEGVGTQLQRTTSAVYDAVGNPVEERDPQGYVTTHVYDARNRRIQTFDPGGGVTQYVYDTADQLVGVIDRAGRSWAYHYDALGRQVGVTDPLGRTTWRTLGWTGNVTAEVDAAGRVTTHAYDALYRRIATSFNGQVTEYEYDNAGNMIRLTDPLGRQSTFSFDLLHQPVASQDALGNTWVTSYDLEGNVLATLDPLGRTTTTTYDPLSRPTAHIDAAGNQLQWTYDALGNVVGVRDGRGTWSTFTYDLHNRRIAETDAYGYSNLFAYDLRDVMVASFDKYGRKTSYSPDPLGQVVAIQDPSNALWQFSYDWAGNTVAQTDPLGRVTFNNFDAAGRLISTRDPLGHQTLVTYDAADNVLSSTDPLERITRFSYDAWDRRLSVIDPLGNQTAWVYDAVGNVLSETRPLGRVTQYEYDSLDRLVKTTDALGGQTLLAYDAVGNLVGQTDPLGNHTGFGYDALDRRTTFVDALNQVSTTSYDANGNVLSVTDPLGRTTGMTYDLLNRLVATRDPLGGETRRDYDPMGNLLSLKNAAGETQAFAYDALNRLVSTKSRDLGTRHVSYDAVGNVLSTTDGNDLTTRTAYDPLNRPVSITDPLGNTFRTVYDAVGNVIETIDPLGHANRMTYDALNRVQSSQDARNAETLISYDALGNRLSLTDALGNVTRWEYDLLDRVVTETDPLGQQQSFRYDAVGNRLAVTKRDDQIIEMSYDPLHRLTAEKWLTDGRTLHTLSFSYDAVGQLLRASDDATQFEWNYDALGRVTTETQMLSSDITATLAGSYDPLGRRTQLVTSVNGTVDSTIAARRDRSGRVVRIEQSGAGVAPKIVSFAYDAGGRRTGTTRFADLDRTQPVAETTFSYDGAGRISGIYHAWDDNLSAAYTLHWDSASRLTNVDSLLDGIAEFTYDATHQLTAAQYSQYADLSFAYDANGNRTGQEYTTGGANQLLSDGQADFSYDRNGNLIRRTDMTSGAVTEYSYDHRDRLTDVRMRATADGPVVKQVRYGYDPLDRRVWQSVDGDGDAIYERTEYFVNDGRRSDSQGAGDSLLLRLNPAGQPLSRYLHGLIVDEVLAEEHLEPNAGDSDLLWLLADHQGSVRDIVRYDAAAQQAVIVDHIFYDAFGQVVAESDAAVEHTFGYTGREWDAETDLQYSRRRYYDPGIARFMTRDPISFAAGDMNLYRYVGNHPTYATDPSGLDDVLIRRLPRYPTLADRRRAWEDYWADRGAVYWSGANPVHLGAKKGDWVYFNSGGRATWTAVNKAARSILNASNSEIEDRIAGIKSPFRINNSSMEIGIFFGGTNQHIHDIGNVERMYNLFQGTKFYHGGIAHPVDYKLDGISGGTGWGFEDGIARALQDVLAHYTPGMRISIYGWSRGAAQSIELARDLDALGIPVEFLGLFDPVYSVGSAGHGSKYIEADGFNENYVSIDTPANVRVATAIYAMNEDRSWFPATRLKPNGKTRLNLIGSPGAHGEVGGHWQSSMQIQQLNLRAMIEFARGQGNVTLAWRGIDSQIQGILDSKYGQQIALRNYLGQKEFSDRRTDWLLAGAVANWQPYSVQQYRDQLFSTVPKDWEPGGFGTQNWDAVNVLYLANAFTRTNVAGKQPVADHYRRILPWVELGLWDIYPGHEGARPFIHSLYFGRIHPKDGGWK